MIPMCSWSALPSLPPPTRPRCPDRFVDLEFDAEVESALNSLSATFSEVIGLVDVDGLTYAEAAEVLDIPVGTVMSRLHRGRKKIREHLRQAGVAPTHRDLETGRSQ